MKLIHQLTEHLHYINCYKIKGGKKVMVYSYLLNSENEIISLCNYDNGKWQKLIINEELDENGTPLTNDLPPELGDKIINGKLVKKVFNEEEEQKKHKCI